MHPKAASWCQTYLGGLGVPGVQREQGLQFPEAPSLLHERAHVVVRGVHPRCVEARAGDYVWNLGSDLWRGGKERTEGKDRIVLHCIPTMLLL